MFSIIYMCFLQYTSVRCECMRQVMSSIHTPPPLIYKKRCFSKSFCNESATGRLEFGSRYCVCRRSFSGIRAMNYLSWIWRNKFLYEPDFYPLDLFAKVNNNLALSSDSLKIHTHIHYQLIVWYCKFICICLQIIYRIYIYIYMILYHLEVITDI